MGLGLAFKAFIKAFREPEKAQKFLDDKPAKPVDHADRSHLRLLQELQQASRLIDFIKEDLTGFNDTQVGSAVRKIQQDSAKVLEELVAIRPLKDEAEGSMITIPKGYNPSEIKVIGKVKGEPPYQGTLVHRGWKAYKHSLPKKSTEQTMEVLFPAEIEIK